MSDRSWLPHPAKEVGPPPPCPVGERFTSQTHAMQATIYGLGPHNLKAAECPLGCGGWHVIECPRPNAGGDCDASWSGTPLRPSHFYGRKVETVKTSKEYL